MGQYSYFLFARPSFCEGMGRIMDFGDTLTEYNTSASSSEADFHALLSDWCAVGDDMRVVLERNRHEQKPKDSATRTPACAR
jgi:hypothetical protein